MFTLQNDRIIILLLTPKSLIMNLHLKKTTVLLLLSIGVFYTIMAQTVNTTFDSQINNII